MPPVKRPVEAVAGLVEILTSIQETEERIDQKVELVQSLYDSIMENSSEDLDTFKEVEEALRRLKDQIEAYKASQGKPVYQVESLIIQDDKVTLNDDIPIEAISNRRRCIIEIYNSEILVPLEKVPDTNDYKLQVVNEKMFDGMTAIVEYLL